jgi:hypothetical protein
MAKSEHALNLIKYPACVATRAAPSLIATQEGGRNLKSFHLPLSLHDAYQVGYKFTVKQTGFISHILRNSIT